MKFDKILLAGQIDVVKSLRDNSISATFHFQDIQSNPGQKGAMMKMLEAKPYPIKVLIVPEDDEVKDEYVAAMKKVKVVETGKSPSQRLRAALHVLYEKQNQKSAETSEMFYNRIITHFLEQTKEAIQNIERRGACEKQFLVYKPLPDLDEIGDLNLDDLEL